MPAVIAASGPQQTLDNLNAIFSSVDAGIVMQAASGEIIECNQAAERVLGLTRDQMMGRTCVDSRWRPVHEDGSDFPGTEHPGPVALATGQAVRDVIMGIHTPDGALRWLTINAVPILEDHTAVRVVVTFTDVTDRRTAELETERLRQTNERSQLMLAAIRDVQALVIAGAEPRLVFDRCLHDILSLSGSRSGFIGQICHPADGRATLTVHAASDPTWMAAAQAAVSDAALTSAAAEPLPALIARTVADGTRVITNEPGSSDACGAEPSCCQVSSFIGLPLFVGAELVGIVALGNRPGGYSEPLAEQLSPYLSTCSQLIHAARERHHRDETQRALAVQRERMTLVLEASGIGHWDWNPVTDEAVFDQRWVGMLGYEPGEIAGTGAQWLQLLHPDDLQATLDAVGRHIKGDVPQHRAEFRMRHRNGEWVWIFAVGRVTERDRNGTVTRMVGVHVDISGRKAHEAALAEATAEAQRANRAKSDFLANMSHEIRTPMNGVIGAANLLHLTALNDEQRGYSETIRRSAEILVSLIEDILDFSKIEAERLELERITLNPLDVIAEVTELEAPRAASKGLELIVNCLAHPDLRVEGDAKRVRQVLLNLVSNAVKFTARGHIAITIEPAGNELRVSVSDTGIGIPPDKHSLVFDKFMQADSSTTRQFGGTGLGLSISKRLVEAMGGTIGVDSHVNKGSTFWFTLPLVPSASDQSAVETPLASSHHAPPTAGPGSTPDSAPLSRQRPLRVLLVEDDEVSRFVGRRMLEKQGCIVEIAEDLVRAVAITADRPFDIVFMDCNMPNMDGIAATTVIRTRGTSGVATGSHVPIIAVTANALVGDRERCLAAGMNDYITKPLLSGSFARALERWRPQIPDTANRKPA